MCSFDVLWKGIYEREREREREREIERERERETERQRERQRDRERDREREGIFQNYGSLLQSFLHTNIYRVIGMMGG
jgi:hypothetical protein